MSYHQPRSSPSHTCTRRASSVRETHLDLSKKVNMSRSMPPSWPLSRGVRGTIAPWPLAPLLRRLVPCFGPSWATAVAMEESWNMEAAMPAPLGTSSRGLPHTVMALVVGHPRRPQRRGVRRRREVAQGSRRQGT